MSISRRGKIALLTLIIFSLLVSGAVFADIRRLVLVTGEATPALELNNKEVRWLFMGLPVVKNDKNIKPLLNASNALVYEVFLQKVIYMSGQNYERRLLAKVFRRGGRRPVTYQNLNRLLQALQTNPNAVSFMWQEIAEKHTNIKIVSTLWSGNID